MLTGHDFNLKQFYPSHHEISVSGRDRPALLNVGVLNGHFKMLVKVQWLLSQGDCDVRSH